MVYSITMYNYGTTNPYAPWCWKIYLQNWAIFGVSIWDDYHYYHSELFWCICWVYQKTHDMSWIIQKRHWHRGLTCLHKSWSNWIWLVVSTPLKNISQLGLLFQICGKIQNVPNHQPGMSSPNSPLPSQRTPQVSQMASWNAIYAERETEGDTFR